MNVQRLSLNMPRLNQNLRIQTLTRLARGGKVSNVSRAFGCHRNTIIRLRQRFQQTCGVADHRRPGRPRVTNPRTDRFITLTHLRRRFKRRQVLQGSTVSANRKCCAASGKPGNPFGQGGPMWDKCLQHVIGLPFCSGHNGISVGGDSSGLGFYSLMSLGLTLVIMAVEFEFLEEEGNVLLIIVSLRGTDLEVGVLWYGVALWSEGKQISLLCKATSMLKVTLTRFCNPFGQGGPMWEKCLQHVIGLPFCSGHSGHNGISVGGDSSGLGFYSLMSLGLTLVIMTVEFEFSEEEGNILFVIVSLRWTDSMVGVLWYVVALWADGKQISLLCKATSMLKVTLTRFCTLKLFLSSKGMGLQY